MASLSRNSFWLQGRMLTVDARLMYDRKDERFILLAVFEVLEFKKKKKIMVTFVGL